MALAKIKHDMFLNELKKAIDDNTMIAEVNCKYIPLFRQKYDSTVHKTIFSSKKYFEYDIICFPRKNGTFDYYHPIAFIEFTSQKIFSSKKFLYEVYRWLWFGWNMGLARGKHPFPGTPLGVIERTEGQEDYSPILEKNFHLRHLKIDYCPENDTDINGKSFCPRFIQIWKTPRAKYHHRSYIKSGLIGMPIDVYEPGDRMHFYSKDVDIHPIFKSVYGVP